MGIFLVTGGAGFYGSHLVETLLSQGDRVRVVDNFSSGALTNLTDVREQIELLFGDLNDQAVVERAVQGVEVVFHLAAPPPATSGDSTDPLSQQAAYALETLNVLAAAKQAGVRRVVFASSVQVYGTGAGGPVREVDQVKPKSAYGFAKLAAEAHCLRYTYLHGLETVRLRFSDTFGPRQCSASLYSQELLAIVKAMLAGRQPVLEEPSLPYQDYLYIDDAVHALLLSATAPRASGQVYNIGRGRYINQLQLVTLVNQILDTHMQPLVGPQTKIGSWNRTMDVGRAETDLGFCPGIDLQQGLVLLMKYYAQHGGVKLPDKLLATPSKKRTTMVRIQHAPSPKQREDPNAKD